MPNDTPEGIGGSLTLEEAVAAYTTPAKEEEALEGHAEPEEQQVEDDVGEVEETDADEGDDEGQAEDEQDEPPAPATVPLEAKVKLPDGEELTVAELIRGNLRDRDYRQKTQALAENHRAVEARVQQIQQFETQLVQDRDFTIQLVQSLMPQEPDPALHAVDPFAYGEAKIQYDAIRRQLDHLVSQNQQAMQRQQAEQAQKLEQIKQREWQATLDKLPELADSTKLNSFVQDVIKYGSEAYGFTASELQTIAFDHRQAVVMRDALAYRKLQENKSKAAAKVEGRPPVLRGGTRQSPDSARAREQKVAMDRLKSSGSLRDGVAALLALEKG